MKLIFSLLLVFCSAYLYAQSIQQYVTADSARQIILHAKTPEEKFSGYYSLDRHYYTTGQYDSSRHAQLELYNIAVGLLSDSLLATTYNAIGNMLVHKSDYNFALTSYFKALEYAKDDFRRSRTYAAVGYLYTLIGNDNLGLSYIKKADSLANTPYLKNVVIGIFYGAAYNAQQKPDTALLYLQKAEAGSGNAPDPTMNAILLVQFSASYQLRQDEDLADVYYKKTLAYCKKEKLISSYIRDANRYCAYLLKRGDYAKAKVLALEILSLARNTISNDGISNVAESLKKIYNHDNKKDSAFYYAEMQISYKDSVSNEKRISEMQNITFTQQLKDIDEESKIKEAEEQRKENIQYALILLGIVTLLLFYLLLSRSFIANEKIIEFFGVVALLIVFEFLNLLLHPFLERITNHSPVLMLLALVCIAALLVPLHHRLENWATKKLVEKNKVIKLAAAKKIIEKFGDNQAK